MIEITFPDGRKKEYPEGVTPYEVARSISEGLARNVISASADGKTIEVTTPLNENTSLVLYTWDDEAGKRAFWHSSAHVLAQAILRFYPEAKLTIGPAIENGFYYDIDFGQEKFTEADFKKVEDKFLELAREKND
ncbi:MAG TPA: TGS domain-containing protein, partial [Candidatus Merdimorpha stercoravium]|nr:TGS domain-containing protein [Candidatus Merdimorpha stercoravium]